MPERVEHNPLQDALAALLTHGLEGAGEALRILVDEASKIERSHFLNAQPQHQASARRVEDLLERGRRRPVSSGHGPSLSSSRQ